LLDAEIEEQTRAEKGQAVLMPQRPPHHQHQVGCGDGVDQQSDHQRANEPVERMVTPDNPPLSRPTDEQAGGHEQRPKEEEEPAEGSVIHGIEEEIAAEGHTDKGE